MGRTRNGARHPASLAQNEALAADIRQRDEVALAALPGWSTFSATQKRFLMALPWFNTIEDACEYAGMTTNAWYKAVSRNPQLLEAKRIRETASGDIARSIAYDLLGLAFGHLAYVLTDPKADSKDKMKATEIVLKANGIGKDYDNQGGQQNFINSQTFINIPGMGGAPTNDHDPIPI